MSLMTPQGLVELFRVRPTLALDLLRETLRCDVPEATNVEVMSALVEPLVPTEHRAVSRGVSLLVQACIFFVERGNVRGTGANK
jgi:hypothetical protein